MEEISKEEIMALCPLRKDSCCGTITLLCELCDLAFDKETAELLLRSKTGKNCILQIRKKDV